jgi:hypothetical protein
MTVNIFTLSKNCKYIFLNLTAVFFFTIYFQLQNFAAQVLFNRSKINFKTFVKYLCIVKHTVYKPKKYRLMVIAKGKGSTSACVLTVLKKVPWVNPLFSSIKTIYKNLGNTVCCFLLLLIFAPYETWFFYVYFF